MLDIKEIKKMDEKTMDAKVASLKADLFQMKMQAVTAGYPKPHQKKIMKKEIARILTVKNSLNEGK